LCIVEVDAGADAGASDAGAGDAGPRDAGAADAAAGQGGNPAVAGAGGQGGTPIFNLGGDAGVVAGSGGLPFKPDGGFGDAGFLLPDGGIDPNNLPGSCDCSVPGNDNGTTPYGTLVLLGLVGVLWRRRKAA
jgi:MYXO-CTERM domain-containing protein